jgi:hypothetical protein
MSSGSRASARVRRGPSLTNLEGLRLDSRGRIRARLFVLTVGGIGFSPSQLASKALFSYGYEEVEGPAGLRGKRSKNKNNKNN